MAMKLDDHIRLWNHASIRVMDIRRTMLEAGVRLQRYHLPANAFLFAVRGQAEVRLDDSMHSMGRFHVLHGGYGACLDITAAERFEYILVLYKSVLMLPSSSSKRSGQQLRSNPFQDQYSFVPSYPLPLLDKLEQMHEDWLRPDSLDAFHARAVFYQFVHELLRQMKSQGVTSVQPDLLAQMLRYMHDQYRKPISLETMAERFECSVSYLTKLFKNRLGDSPMRLLTSIRMDRTVEHLLRTDASLQDIAELVGYPDAHTLSRSFKKYFGLPPVQFRTRYQSGAPVPKLPKSRMKTALVAADPRCYSVNDYEYHYHLVARGGLPVNKVSKTASLTTATLLLCIALVLSACSGTANSGNANSTGNGTVTAAPGNQAAEAVPEPSSAAAAATKSYTNSLGTVTIPVQAKRIIDLTGSAIGNLLELGIKPVGATYDAMRNPFHEGMLEGVVNLGTEPNAEAILDLEPDLIIAYNYLEEAQFEQLSEIAPVVRLSYGEATPSELLLEFGKITGREEQAQAWVEEWNKKIADVKPKIQAVVGDSTVSILQPYAKGIYAWGDKGGRGGEIIHGDLGLKAPAIIQSKLVDGDEFGANLSVEQLPEYAGDYIFTSNWGWDDGNPDDVYESSLWKTLPAVKNNQVYFINAEGSYYNDPISLEAQLDFIVESFLGKQ